MILVPKGLPEREGELRGRGKVRFDVVLESVPTAKQLPIALAQHYLDIKRRGRL